MDHDTPLRKAHQTYVDQRAKSPSSAPAGANRPGAARSESVQPVELEYLSYGPADTTEPLCELVASFGEVEAEYAALRRGAALQDCPQRGTLIVTGADRRDFLNSMLTNELKDLEPGTSKRAFWLNRKGRIDADLLLAEMGNQLLIDVDIHQASATVETLTSFVFTEDVVIENATETMYRICIHGAQAIALLGAATSDDSFTLGDNCAARVILAGHEVDVIRSDQVGEVGLHCFVQREHAEIIWNHLLALDGGHGDKLRIRPIGWYAFNIARIEAGTPLFNIDFGPTNLPHETGVLRDRVSFTKGCYLGQEIVARMESLGKPKRMLAGLRVQGNLQPIEGAQVFVHESEGTLGDPIGVVTSSTISPMLGAVPISFAMLKTELAQPDTKVLVNAEGQQVAATVQALRFLPEPASTA
jgi:folate-binding protein YgfZ